MPQRTVDSRPPASALPDQPREEAIERSFDRIVEEGRPRLERKLPDMLATGIVGGIEVGFGVLALLLVKHDTGSDVLAGLAFSIGFIALRLGHSELFTEGFLVPVTVVAAGEARVRDLFRVWGWTLVGNLFGGWIMMSLVSAAFAELHRTAMESATFYVRSGFAFHTLSRAILAGAAMTMMTRMHNGTDSEVAKLIACVAIGFLLAGARLFHSVLDSLLAFAALSTGRAPFGYLDWAAWLGWAILGNLIGGMVLTTFLRLVRSRARLADHRIANSRRPLPGTRVTSGDGPAES
jgi:formate/nitrite transporter FocA (FNT family)